MKRRTLYFGFVLLMLASTLAWAQSGSNSSNQNGTSSGNFFVKTVYLNKVYPTRYGYVVAYVDSEEQYQEAYLPMSWFNTGNGKGQLLYGTSANYPYMNVYWKNGKFDFVQLYVQTSLQNPSWGFLQDTPQLKAKFNVTTLKMKF